MSNFFNIIQSIINFNGHSSDVSKGTEMLKPANMTPYVSLIEQHDWRDGRYDSQNNRISQIVDGKSVTAKSLRKGDDCSVKSASLHVRFYYTHV